MARMYPDQMNDYFGYAKYVEEENHGCHNCGHLISNQFTGGYCSSYCWDYDWEKTDRRDGADALVHWEKRHPLEIQQFKNGVT